MGVGHGGLTDPGRKPGVNGTGKHNLGGVPGAVGPEKPRAKRFYRRTANAEWSGVRYAVPKSLFAGTLTLPSNSEAPHDQIPDSRRGARRRPAGRPAAGGPRGAARPHP